MDEENLRSFTYNELKMIALEHDIFKSIKSKKKDVLLKRLIDFFNKDSQAVGDHKPHRLNLFDSSSSPDPENVNSLKMRKKRNASKKSDITSVILPAKLNSTEMEGIEGKENIPEPIYLDEVSEPPKKRGRKPKAKKQISNATLDTSGEKKDNSNEIENNHVNLSSGDAESCETSNSRRRGRKKKNKTNKSDEDTTLEDPPELSERRGTFVVKSTEDQSIVAPSFESTCNASLRPNRIARGRRYKSDEKSENFSKQEKVQSPILPESDPDSFGNKEAVISKSNMTPEVGKKRVKKMTKGRKQATISEDLDSIADKSLEERRGTFVVSIQDPGESSEIINNSDTVRQSRRNNSGIIEKCLKNNSDDNKISLCNEEVLSNDLPVGAIPDGARRGTFSISKPSTSGSDESLLSSDILTRSQEKKRKRSKILVNLSQENPSSSFSSTQSSPRRITKKAKLVVPVTPLIYKKSIKFMTPPGGVKSTTFNKSAITYTPDPRKKSVTTPISVKKTPGQFSATKMPNFAKIHEKNFGKMESLLAYSERKTARSLINSPLNKTFSGLKTKDIVKRTINQTRRENGASKIPVRSQSPVRLNNKENCSRALKKIPDCTVEKIREKGRDIIKGVRSNKRFMLQMKMRNLAP